MASHSHLLLAVFEAPQNSPPIPCCCESMLGWLCADKRRHPSLLSGPRRSNKRIWHGTLNPEPLSLWLASVGELPLSLLINQEIFQLSFSLSNSISLELSPPTLSLSLAIALSFFASNSFEGIWLLLASMPIKTISLYMIRTFISKHSIFRNCSNTAGMTPHVALIRVDLVMYPFPYLFMDFRQILDSGSNVNLEVLWFWQISCAMNSKLVTLIMHKCLDVLNNCLLIIRFYTNLWSSCMLSLN